jgi:hypothetical protein
MPWGLRSTLIRNHPLVSGAYMLLNASATTDPE